MRGQVRRLAPRGDRLDDIGGQEGQRQEAAEVAIADPLDGGEFGDAAGLTRDERLETAMRRLISFTSTGSGFAGAAEGPSMTSRISTPRRLIRSRTSRVSTASRRAGALVRGGQEGGQRCSAVSSPPRRHAFKPKKRGPDQRVPVIRRATSDSER